MDSLQIVAEPRRREILRLVWDRELAAGEIAAKFDLTFGAVSQHLGVLRKAGLVSMRKEGNHRFYRADLDTTSPLRATLEAMWESTLDRLVRAIEET
jgi:DNA-binding transcriptional ArsR family regulator